MTQTSSSDKNEPLPTTEGSEMLERFWAENRAEIEGINIVGDRTRLFVTSTEFSLLVADGFPSQ